MSITILPEKARRAQLKIHIWKRVPSVTTGGKPYFWLRFDQGVRHVIVWDRVYKYWTLQIGG